jgi:hypothetical protein
MYQMQFNISVIVVNAIRENCRLRMKKLNDSMWTEKMVKRANKTRLNTISSK